MSEGLTINKWRRSALKTAKEGRMMRILLMISLGGVMLVSSSALANPYMCYRAIKKVGESAFSIAQNELVAFQEDCEANIECKQGCRSDRKSWKKMVKSWKKDCLNQCKSCLLYTSPSPRDLSTSRMPSSA